MSEINELREKLAMLLRGYDPEQMPRQHLVSRMRADLARNKAAFGHLPGRSDGFARNEEGLAAMEQELRAAHAKKGEEIARLKAEIEALA